MVAPKGMGILYPDFTSPGELAPGYRCQLRLHSAHHTPAGTLPQYLSRLAYLVCLEGEPYALGEWYRLQVTRLMIGRDWVELLADEQVPFELDARFETFGNRLERFRVVVHLGTRVFETERFVHLRDAVRGISIRVVCDDGRVGSTVHICLSGYATCELQSCNS